MFNRKKMDGAKSRRDFSRGANRIHRKNVQDSSPVMRGGIRL